MSAAVLSFPSVSTALTPEQIVSELRHLPSAPKVLPRLKKLLCDTNSSMMEIVGLIRLDPGIAARVLQVGNSAFYSKGQRCVSVEDAVHRVGYDQVYDLVSYAVASQVLVRPLAVYGIEADSLWRQSVTCALAAEMLAIETGEDRSVAYTIGLLHAIGMVAIDEWALRNGPTLVFTYQNLPKEFTESERALLGFTQAEVSAALLRSWDFPKEMWDPLRWQYAPRNSGGYVKMACILAASKWLRSAVCSETGEWPPMLDERLLLPLRMAASTLERKVGVIRTRLNEVRDLLEG